MKNLFFLIYIFLFFNCSTRESVRQGAIAEDSIKKNTAKESAVIPKYLSFIKKNYQIIDSAKGDLNKDNNLDIALITEDKVDNEYKRELIILFFDPGTKWYKESIRSATAIPGSTDMFNENNNRYFGKLSVKNGTLIFENELSPAGNEKYVYRFQNSQWKLIGYTGSYPRQGYAFTIDYNLNTGRFLADINAVSEDTSFIKVDTLIQLKELPDIEEYYPNSLEFNIRGLTVYL